ncbi:conjugal transfer protein TraG N-terminal domain-containing protein [Escherichia coli]|uniref:conjugal transfer protein TraG N-terminal domain-containing protein n=1 Tax=Escherichia coli TaxID=562 RepID=UPI0018E86395|nr:conjugal transfer protein TraG N-terminal domain-containing protein [Escherichia coli]MBJ1991055.1 conjugal transfer protein TraG N-terminal domain-containing protein [Escherichia coli]
MTTNNYLEYFLTLLGWVVNNGLWNVLISTGLFALPLAFRIIGIWLKVREEGADEGNKGMLSLPRIEHVLYGAFFVMISCCVPLVQVTLDTLSFDKSRVQTCGVWTPEEPGETGYSGVISSIGDQTAAAPVWWVVVHKLSKGVTQAAVASIPCRPDLRQLRFEIQRTFIENRALADELQDFTNDCYSLALYMWKQRDQGQSKDKKVLDDISWIGSATFMQGDYGTLQSKMPRAAFPWNTARDSGRPDTGRGGYPTCREWWSDSSVGLKKRVMEEVSDHYWLRLSAAMKMIGSSQVDYKEEVIKRLVSPANLTLSQGGEVYRGYGGNADMTTMNAVARIAGTAGSAVAALGAFPALDAMRQALPMVQSIILMAIYIMIPLILAFAAYELSTLITLTFVVFAVHFLTFWWELARWLDSWMLTALYSSDTHTRFNMMGFQNTSDDLIMNLVMGTMFLVLPAVWLGALSWAGVSVGTVMGDAINKGTSNVSKAAAKSGDLANK